MATARHLLEQEGETDVAALPGVGDEAERVGHYVTSPGPTHALAGPPHALAGLVCRYIFWLGWLSEIWKKEN